MTPRTLFEKIRSGHALFEDLYRSERPRLFEAPEGR
jgi:hypothetical protein